MINIVKLLTSSLILMFLSWETWAQLRGPVDQYHQGRHRQETIIQCLGNEEFQIHHYKYNGPLYALNQKMVNTFIVSSDLQLKAEYIQRICHSPYFSPSVNLLRHLLLEGAPLFENNEKDHVLRIQKNQLIEVFLSDIPLLFFQYLADLQALLPNATCMKEQLPEVDKLLFEYQYVEPEAAWNKELLGKKRLDKIFNGLKNFDSLVEKCKRKKVVTRPVPQSSP